MAAEARARTIADKVLMMARSAGKGAEAIVEVSQSQTGNTRFAVSEITSSGEVERTDISVRIQIGKRSATSTTNQLDDKSLADVVERTVRMATISPEDPEHMPALGRQSYLAVKGAVDAGTTAMTPAARAKSIAAALGSGDKLVLAAFFEHGRQATSLATSAGLWAHHELTSWSMSCTARTPDGTGSGWAGAASEIKSLPGGDIASWLEKRRTAVKDRVSTMRVGHVDFFATPSVTR